MRPGRKPTALLALVAAVAVVGVAVWATTPWSSSRATHGTKSVRVHRSRLGPILVDARGHTLYLFAEDEHGRSTCYRGCARLWPPALVSGRPTAGSGVSALKLTAQRRTDSGSQLVYNGHPLYTLADEKPGALEGQGWMGSWFVVSPAGEQLGKAHRPAGGY